MSTRPLDDHPDRMGLVVQLVSGIMSLTFMLVKFMFRMLFMVVRGVAGLFGAR